MDDRQKLLLQRLRASNIAAAARIRDQITDAVVGAWSSMDSWRDADVVQFQNRAIPILAAGERKMALLTNGYLAASANAATGTNRPTEVIDLRKVTGAALRNGVEPTEVLRRPQMVLNYQLSKGQTLTKAVAASEKRLRSLTTSNLQLARTRTAAQRKERRYFRRVLTGGENCSLCVIASTQRYNHGSLMPIHGGCDCGIAEEFGTVGQVLDPVTLNDIHAAIAEQFGDSDLAARMIDGRNKRSDYLDLIATREHGELGPTLTWRDQHFRGPAEVAALTH